MTRYSAPPCPQDPAHGPLLDWPTATAAWYCCNVRHTGRGFYRTDLTTAHERVGATLTTRAGAVRRDPTLGLMP